MSDFPWGYLVWVLVAVVAAGAALWPRPTHGARMTPSLVLGTASSEVPGLFLLALAASTVLAISSGDLSGAGGLACAAVAATVAVALVGVQARAFRAGPTVVAAVDAALQASGPEAPRLTAGERLRTVLAPLRWPSRDVEVLRDLAYGPHGRANRLDLYRSQAGATDAPVLVYLHGGGYASGHKSRESILLLEALARRGWVGVSANYRLAPTARFPDFLVDAKRVIAWVRTEGAAYGLGRTVVVCGGSAGANLAMTAALTAGHEDLQPGFEGVDTSAQATICLYGYYGPAPGDSTRSAPEDHLAPGAPPTLIIHGARDPMVPPAAARRFAEQLRAVSTSAVAYAELPGAQHTFDRFDSVREGGVVRGVLHFLRSTGLPLGAASGTGRDLVTRRQWRP